MSLKEEFDIRRVLDRLRVPQRVASLEASTARFAKVSGVRTVNGISPDDRGNVTVSGGGGGTSVKSVDGVTPDGTGNIGLTSSDASVTITPGTNTIDLKSVNSGVTSITGTANQVIASAATGAVTLSLPQNIATTSSPTFAGLTLTSPLTVANGGTGQTSYTDGQLLIGNTTGNTLTKATLTSTANQTTVTNGHGTIQVGTVQNIGTTSAPTFAGMTMNGTITMDGTHTITNGITPTNATDYAIKSYVDSISSGIIPYQAVKYTATAALPANTYNNGASGVGATLTANANGALVVDGITPSVNDRILIRKEAASANNGVYKVTTVGSAGAAYVLTRATDFNQASNILKGAYFLVTGGTALADSAWFENLTVTTVGTDPINFVQFSQATAYVAGNGISIAGLTISAVGDGTNITVGGGGIGFATNAMSGLNAVSATTGTLALGNGGTWNALGIGAANTALTTDGTTASWNKINENNLSFTDITTANASTSKHGLLPKASGNATDVLKGDLTYGTFVGSITGTANQVIASSSTGAVTLSLPQSIATSSTPTFGGVTASGTVDAGAVMMTIANNSVATSTPSSRFILSGPGGNNSFSFQYINNSDTGGLAGVVLARNSSSAATAELRFQQDGTRPVTFYTNGSVGLQVKGDQSIQMPKYGAGAAVFDASGNISSQGITTTITTSSLVGKTITVTNGVITGFA